MQSDAAFDFLTLHQMVEDIRLPHEIQAVLERLVLAPFVSDESAGTLKYRTEIKIMGILYRLLLSFESAQNQFNYYQLTCMTSWPTAVRASSDQYRRTAMSWFELWTGQLASVASAPAVKSIPELYHQRCEESYRAELRLQSVPSIQDAILSAMKEGATFSTCHKEGGTNIFWRSDQFVRSDYGDELATVRYETESEFMSKLFAFFRWQVSRIHEPSELVIWRLIFRQLQPAK